MRGFLFSAAFVTLFPGTVQGTEPEGIVDKLDSAVVVTSRAGETTPVTYSMVSHEQLRSVSPMSSVPMALALQPSVVAVNEGGTGLGYSKLTVRGSKGSQINVTLNGITLNDAESQEVFWVNIPALSGMLGSIQLQRGLGTTASGAGAFGASINMNTTGVRSEPHASVDLGYGSYDTFTAAASVGTGITRSGVFFDFFLSRGVTDGYIRNAFAEVKSSLATIGWMNGSNSIKLTWLYGDQHTGITWHGIDLEQYHKDRRYNPAGEYQDGYGNIRYYDNDTDNYTQHHLQLNYTHQFGRKILWSTTLNWTHGDGWYENYNSGDAFQDYNFPTDWKYETYDENGAVSRVWTAGSEADFIVREAMLNDYLVLNSDIRYSDDVLNLTAGLNLSRYDGDHIGRLIWNDVLGDSYDYDSHEWYLNNALKQEANAFVRAEYRARKWMTVYGDLQYRGVKLDMTGPEDDRVPLDYSTAWHFLNPRAGMSFHWAPGHKAYVSAALGHREPGRSDIKENIKNAYIAASAGVDGEGVTLKPEKMLDIEVGYTYVSDNLSLSANIYLMEYWDMLLETGRLTSVGYAVKENVDRSWRRGVELAGSWQALTWLKADANLTLSMNRIKNHTEFIQNIDDLDNWNPTGRTTAFTYGRAVMLMSPSVTSMASLSFMPFRGSASNSLKTLALTVNGKYVGKQYLDNTMTESRSIPGYFVSDLTLSHEFRLAETSDTGSRKSTVGLSLHVGNIFNNMYYADGWCWKNWSEKEKEVADGIGIYPQAPRNFMLKLSYRF